MTSGLDALRALDRPIAFGHYGLVNDISGVTTWLHGLLAYLHAEGVPLVVRSHHIGAGIEDSSLVGQLRTMGVAVELVQRGPSMEQDIRDTLDFLERHRPAMFLPQCLNEMYIAAGIAGAQGLPWLLTMHSDDPDYWEIARHTLPERCGGRLVCVSQHLAERCRQEGLAAEPVVIPYGVEVPLDSAVFKADPFTVIYSGRLVEEQKRFGLVVETMVHACRSDHRLRFKVLGQGPAEVEARRVVDEAGLNARIHFLGRLDPGQVGQELLEAQALILMSDYEGLPVSMLEAMAAGVVPVVRATESGIPELVVEGATGILVGDDPIAAAGRIVQLANDQVRWERCSQGARELITKRYSNHSSYEQWVALIAGSASLATWSGGPLVPKHIEVPPLGSRLAKGYRAIPVNDSISTRIGRLLGFFRQS